MQELKLADKSVLITGVDSGIGKAVALLAATKGAIVSFTCSLALQAKPKGIRVNAVAPGPVATPLTKETFDEKEEDPGKPPLERNATPEEVAESFLFLVSEGAAQITGQVLHPNGGLIVNG